MKQTSPKRRRQSVGPHDIRLAYFAGVVAARDNQTRASNPHYGAEATAWREGFDYVRDAYRANPDAGTYLPFWQARDKARAERRQYLDRTKGARLAKSLRGRDRGGAVKAAERGAIKTGKFWIRATNRLETLNLARASRRAAEDLAAEFKAAGYRVEITEA